jgi:hypothetical protein
MVQGRAPLALASSKLKGVCTRPALPEAQPMAGVAARDSPTMRARRGGRGGGQALLG